MSTKRLTVNLLAAATFGTLVALPGLTAADTSPAAAERTAAAVPSVAQLAPVGVEGEQSHINLTSDQMANAKKIVDVVNRRHLPHYAAVVSIATALQESKLENLNVAVDYDSLGLFQQRPSCGWGTPAQLVDPSYATNAFLNALEKAVPNYTNTPLWQAAQETQQSAFPMAYAQWQDQAMKIVQAVQTQNG